jgi:two-component system, OmpR family, sensor histidine kinase SenX3
MQITGRRKKIAFFVVLGICLVALAVTLNVSWIILHWRQGVLLFVGVIFFAAIILGMILNTGFLVREIRLNEQHDSFINAVTHELKTPITSIRLYLETLQRRDVDEAQRQQFYKLMLDDTDRLRGTVEQVLKAGEVRYRRTAARNPVEVDFPGIVGECMDLARSRHHLQPAALHWQDSARANGDGKAAGPAIKVHGDADELRTAISNILDNAIKYSGAEVNVSVAIETPDDRRVVLRVRDRGVGIPAGELKRIFKRFYRVPRRAASHAKGTGLGLFIVRAIARAHGGKVFAESAGEAHGTTVTLELPRSAA